MSPKHTRHPDYFNKLAASPFHFHDYFNKLAASPFHFQAASPFHFQLRPRFIFPRPRFIFLRAEQLAALADALNVTADYLLGRSDARQPAPKGPPGKLRLAFERAHKLPRHEQNQIVKFVEAYVSQYASKAS